MKTKETVSERNRRELQEWFEKSDYSGIRFWIKPNLSVSEDECVAEILNALKNWEKDKVTSNPL